MIYLPTKLTLKQKKFADEYIITGNVYQSAVKAGYKETYAKGNSSKLLENVRVKTYIDERLKKLEDEKIAKQDEVLKYLTKVMRGKSLSSAVVVEGKGDGCSEAKLIEKPPDEKEKLKAAELLGKRYALFTEKTQIDTDAKVVIVDDIK